jgi:hypothetical protein
MEQSVLLYMSRNRHRRGASEFSYMMLSDSPTARPARARHNGRVAEVSAIAPGLLPMLTSAD